VALRHHTMVERNGAPHVGVAPLLTVKSPATALGVLSHSVICGLLPRENRLEASTKEFRRICETAIERGARERYDAGIQMLLSYYESADDFDPTSITTLLPKDLPVVTALRAAPACSLVFYVFDLTERSEIGRMRCLDYSGRAEVLQEGPVYDNVWWHNTMFHGEAEDAVVIRFHHQATHDTRFGQMERLD